MCKYYFDPSETVRGIQQLLVSDKKKIAFLFGAGTSLARRDDKAPFIPAVAKMTEIVEKKIIENAKHESALQEIKNEFLSNNLEFTVESLLSNVEDKIRVLGKGTLNGLSRNEFESLAELIKCEIRNIVSIHKEIDENTACDLIQYDFAKWIKNADRKYAVEIFTTNYDYFFEIGLEAADVPFYDGFTGSYRPFFNASSLEDMTYLPKQTKLWKIHGSLGLHELKTSSNYKIIRKNSDSEDLLIYPSTFKYSNSKKMPYIAFMDRLNDFLKQDDAVLFVCGYSFMDEHINERIFSALDKNNSSHVFIFYYDVMLENGVKKYLLNQDNKLSQMALHNRRLSVLGMRHAIIGATFGEWKLKREPDKNDTLNTQWYFDEDAPINISADIKVEYNKGEVWTGEGEFVLPDFVRFIDFLKNMIPKNEWMEGNNGKNSN